MPAERHHAFSRTFTRSVECESRSGVTGKRGQFRLEAESNIFSESDVTVRSMSGGPICFLSQCPVGILHELETRSWFNTNRCSQSAMDKPEGVCLSPVLPDRQVPVKNTAPRAGFDSASLANPAMVSSTEGVIVLRGDSSSSPFKPTAKCVGGTPPPFGAGLTNPSRVACVRANLKNKGISEQASALILASWRKILKLHTPVAGRNGNSGVHSMDLNLFVHL